MPDRQRLLELALKGLEAERAKLDDEIAQIKSQFSSRAGTRVGPSGGSTTTAGIKTKQKRKMSEEAKRKISEAMKRRYAEKKRAARK